MIGRDLWERLRKAGIITSFDKEKRKEEIRKAGPHKIMSIKGIGIDKAYILLASSGRKMSKNKLRDIYDRLHTRTNYYDVKASKARKSSQKPKPDIKGIIKQIMEDKKDDLARRFIVFLIKPTSELNDLHEKIESDNAIAYNGRIHHKISHITIEPPAIKTLEQCKSLIEKIHDFPNEFEITSVHKFPKSSKLMFLGKFNNNFDKIEIPHVTFAEFKNNKIAEQYLEKNKNYLDRFIGQKFDVLAAGIVKKNFGVEWLIPIKSYKKQSIDFDPEQISIFLDMLNNKNPIKYQVFKPSVDGVVQKYSVRNIFVDSKEEVIKLAKEDNSKGLVCVCINEHKQNGKAENIENIDTILTLSFDIDVKKERKIGYVSTEEDHLHAICIAFFKIMPALLRHNIKVSLIIDSGNGAHVYSKVNIKLPKLTREKWLKHSIYRRLITLEKELKSFEDNIVNIDNITKDVVRRMKLPGTINMKDTKQKENRLCRIIYQANNYHEKENTKAFTKIKLSEEITIISDENSKEKISNGEIKNIIERDRKLNDLYNGDWQKYGFPTKSEAEQSIVDIFVAYGLNNKQIHDLMENCKIGKWQNSNESYKRLTLQKARGFVKARKYIKKESEDLARLREEIKAIIQ
jgi:hypothetical protein